MSDFQLFEEALNAYNNKQNTTEPENEDSDGEIEFEICKHLNYDAENSSVFCLDCGQELEKSIFKDKEWRYYGQSDNKRTSDPTRVVPRKFEDRNIYKDVESMGFSDKIVYLANQIYIEVTKGQIFRGNSRRAIVFASIFHAFKLRGKPQSHDKLIKIFGLNRKIGLKGLKHVNLNAPKDSLIHTTYITPENLIEDIMDKFKATQEQKNEVIELYHKIKNKSSKINRARPQSVASALTYFWICIKGLDISLKDFAKKSDLSELTIDRLAKEIATILNVNIS
jgi:transcription initiation factor TFIIIB Brf1 subunit/transcription initiation factor TFIIB